AIARIVRPSVAADHLAPHVRSATSLAGGRRIDPGPDAAGLTAPPGLLNAPSDTGGVMKRRATRVCSAVVRKRHLTWKASGVERAALPFGQALDDSVSDARHHVLGNVRAIDLGHVS